MTLEFKYLVDKFKSESHYVLIMNADNLIMERRMAMWLKKQSYRVNRKRVTCLNTNF